MPGWLPLVAVALLVVFAVWAFGRVSSCASSAHDAGQGAGAEQAAQAPGQAYSYTEGVSYASNSIINRPDLGSPPVFKPNAVAVAAAERKHENDHDELERQIARQKERASRVDLASRAQTFARGTSFPSNFESNGEKIIYLTFDDGPSSVTPQILDTLDRYGVRATFFVTNFMPLYAGSIGDAYRRGHTIGLHTSSHNYDVLYSSPDAYYADLQAIADTVESEIGYVPCFIRFPGGTSNTVSADYCSGIMSQLSWEVPELGYQYYDWNWDSADASGNLSASEIIDHTINLNPYEDNTNLIVLMHDANHKQTTAEALPTIIEHFLLQGYSFDAITPESMVYQFPPAN